MIAVPYGIGQKGLKIPGPFPIVKLKFWPEEVHGRKTLMTFGLIIT
jgi:hypothetical protein